MFRQGDGGSDGGTLGNLNRILVGGAHFVRSQQFGTGASGVGGTGLFVNPGTKTPLVMTIETRARISFV